MGRSVLICDDAMFARASLKQLLVRAGFDVVGEAVNGKDAVSKYKSLRPELTTMDIVMPEMSGLDALRAIIEEDPNARVVMCTAMGQDSMIADAISSGARGAVVKPFTWEQVLSAMESALA